MRLWEKIKDLLRHIARSLERIPKPIENQSNTENTESLGGNTVGTSIAAALAPVTLFEKNRMAQQKGFFNNHADKAPALEEACRQLDIEKSEVPCVGISSPPASCGREDSYLEQGKSQELETLRVSYFVTNFEWLRAKHKEGFNTVIIIDEAHTIKDENTGKYGVLSNLATRNFILLTGTLVMNWDIDIAAMLSLFRPNSLCEDMQCDRKTN
ncbi:hypothetical protein BHYA_0074g00310 [Botrytis hyacinthi]|uniref:SNF2 N-terminal domain-containing protein n=1 Tax=Botrytis hyacinthi TaxID=278943 RepID=A0A4Z1GSU5_9HELO|nr:hypothetical protein BHYA_0074g00310 [Botrytis hyacinthi]